MPSFYQDGKRVTGGITNAKNIKYDNSVSGLTSENVQDVVDEINSNLNSGSNKNLLDNPWFTVNQRGQSNYAGEVYTVDRWIGQWTGDGVTTVEEQGISIFREAYESHICQRLIIPNEIEGKTITISIIAKGNVGLKLSKVSDDSWTTTVSKVIEKGALEYSDWTLVQLTANNIVPGKYVFEIYAVRNTIGYIKCAKLEVGSISTLENDVQPNHEYELFKCITSTVDSSDTYSNKSISEISKYNVFNHDTFGKNFMLVNLNNPNSRINQRSSFIWNKSDTGWDSVPPWNEETVMGVRDVYLYDNTHCCVQILEFYPNRGRVWTAFYNGNSDWEGGWNCSFTSINNNPYRLQISRTFDSGTSYAHLQADEEGGNLRLSKNDNQAHLELDTCTMNGTDGYARIYLGNSDTEANKIFAFNEDGTFSDGNGINTQNLYDSINKFSGLDNVNWDCNNLDTQFIPGIYKCLKDNTVGFPSDIFSEWIFVQVFNYGNNYAVQVAHDMNGYKVATRYCRNGSWSDWKEISGSDRVNKAMSLSDIMKLVSTKKDLTFSGTLSLSADISPIGRETLFQCVVNSQNGVNRSTGVSNYDVSCSIIAHKVNEMHIYVGIIMGKGTEESPFTIHWSPDLIDGYLKTTGGTLTGELTVNMNGSTARLFADNEGGTLDLRNKNYNVGTQVDMCDGTFRAYHYDIDPWVLNNGFNLTKDAFVTNKKIYCDGGKEVATKEDFQAGVDKIYNACVSAGSTPVDKSADACANAIGELNSNLANKPYGSFSVSFNYNSGITSKSISFGKTFDKVPRVAVFLSDLNTNIQGYLRVTNVTTSGFQVYAYTSSANITVDFEYLLCFDY